MLSHMQVLDLILHTAYSVGASQQGLERQTSLNSPDRRSEQLAP